MALVDRAIVRMLPAVPRPVVRRLSSRYIAGSELADALDAVRRLNARGKAATVDVLGEESATPEEADAVVGAYEEALAGIDEEGLDANVSVKPTALGLLLDPELCARNVRRLAEAASGRDGFVRIDMEDASTTTATLDVYRRLRDGGVDNVGVVLQARLRRTLDDVRDLLPLRPSVRVCKGIYEEPPGIGYQGFDTVRLNFLEAVAALLDGGAYVAVATHDAWLLAESLRLVDERGLAPDRYELQMLLGVRGDLADELVREGHRVRVYVPYGRDWYDYSLRRLRENPRIAGYVAADTLRRLRP